MKQKIFCLLTALTVVLCGCDKDTRVDIIGFCNAFNEISQTIKISDKSLIKESGRGDYIIYVKDNDTQILIRVGCDEDNAVTSCIVSGDDKEAVAVAAKTAVEATGNALPKKLLSEIKGQNQNISAQTDNQWYAWYASDGYYTLTWKIIQ